MKYCFSSPLILLLAFVLQSNTLFAQEKEQKFEKEISIDQEDFPKNSLELVQPMLEKSEKTKFYKEFDGSNYYYELKTRYKGEFLSIKFKEDGSLFDIEILKEFNELPEKVQQAIKNYFQQNYKKYRLDRIQIQYNREEEYKDGELEIDEDEEYLEEFLEMDLEDLIIKYEIEAETLDEENKRGFFEFLFNSQGQIEKVRRIVKRADDNVLY